MRNPTPSAKEGHNIFRTVLFATREQAKVMRRIGVSQRLRLMVAQPASIDRSGTMYAKRKVPCEPNDALEIDSCTT